MYMVSQKRIVLTTVISYKLQIKSTFLRMNIFTYANSFATPYFSKVQHFYVSETS